jgi:hypothetical protein
MKRRVDGKGNRRDDAFPIDSIFMFGRWLSIRRGCIKETGDLTSYQHVYTKRRRRKRATVIKSTQLHMPC